MTEQELRKKYETEKKLVSVLKFIEENGLKKYLKDVQRECLSIASELCDDDFHFSLSEDKSYVTMSITVSGGWGEVCDVLDCIDNNVDVDEYLTKEQQDKFVVEVVQKKFFGVWVDY